MLWAKLRVAAWSRRNREGPGKILEDVPGGIFLSDEIYPWKPGLLGTGGDASPFVAGAKHKVVPKRSVVSVWRGRVAGGLCQGPGAWGRLPREEVSLLQVAAEPCGPGLKPTAAKPLRHGDGPRTVGWGAPGEDRSGERALAVGR